MNKSIIILPYFGKLPQWIDLFLYSCGKNDELDFLFITDCSFDRLSVIPNNFIIRKTSFCEYCSMVSYRLQISFNPNSPYKLCDLRPWYGHIHHLDIQKYDYWGYGDLDLCYGNLSKWLNPFWNSNKEVFSTHPDRISGHFALFKNNEKYRNLAFKIPDWQNLLSSNKHYALDEVLFSNLILKRQRYFRGLVYRITKNYNKRQKLLSFINSLIFPQHKMSELHTTLRPNKEDEWIYNSTTNCICYNNKEIPYLHFLFFKKTDYWAENENYWNDNFYKLNHCCPEKLYHKVS